MTTISDFIQRVEIDYPPTDPSNVENFADFRAEVRIKRDLYKAIAALKVAVEALEFYANGNEFWVASSSPLVNDSGKKSREALLVIENIISKPSG